jgi:hypothetical protein
VTTSAVALVVTVVVKSRVELDVHAPAAHAASRSNPTSVKLMTTMVTGESPQESDRVRDPTTVSCDA